MEIHEYFSSVLEALLLNKTRTALAMLGVIIGIASVVTLMSLGESSKRAVQNEIEKLGTNLISVVGQQNLSQKDLEAIQNDKDLAIQGISPELSSATDISFGKNSKNVGTMGVTSAYLQVHDASLQKGTFFMDDNINNSPKTVVLGPQLTRYLFGDGDPLGQKVKIKGQYYTVVGVTQAKGGANFAGPDMMAFVPLSTAQNRLLGIKKFDSISIQLKNATNITAAKEELKQILLARHKITDPNNADFQIQSQEDILKTASKITDTFSSQLIGIAIISLIVGGIGIMNVMLVTVIERTGEIGLRKAVGAPNTAIITQFLGEAVLLTFFGGIMGVLSGYGVSFLIFLVTNKPYAFSLIAVVLALIMSTTVGIIFGWYPAWKASKLSPIDALRYE